MSYRTAEQLMLTPNAQHSENRSEKHLRPAEDHSRAYAVPMQSESCYSSGLPQVAVSCRRHQPPRTSSAASCGWRIRPSAAADAEPWPSNGAGAHRLGRLRRAPDAPLVRDPSASERRRPWEVPLAESRRPLHQHPGPGLDQLGSGGCRPAAAALGGEQGLGSDPPGTPTAGTALSTRAADPRRRR